MGNHDQLTNEESDIELAKADGKHDVRPKIKSNGKPKDSAEDQQNKSKNKILGLRIFPCFHSNIKKSHWEPDSDHPVCFGCQKKFKVLFRRHHCRRCGKVFCFHCSGLKMRLDENAEIWPDGDYHRVCFFCYKSKDVNFSFNEQEAGQTLSLTVFFTRAREEAFQRTTFSSDKSKHMFKSEVFELCQPIMDVFMKKKTEENLVKNKVKAMGVAIKATNRESVCNGCSYFIMVPNKRKVCLLCTKVFCKSCSCKEIVMYSVESGSKKIDITITNEFKEYQMKSSKCEQFRTCFGCKRKIKILLDKANFDEKLDSSQRALSYLQFQIYQAILQQDKGIVSRHLMNEVMEMSSFENVTEVTSPDESMESFDVVTESDNMREGSRISLGLINEFFDEYKALSKLKPETEGRAQLVRNVRKAMIDYYFETKPSILRASFRDEEQKTTKEVTL